MNLKLSIFLLINHEVNPKQTYTDDFNSTRGEAVAI